jgi:hypothetical protein
MTSLPCPVLDSCEGCGSPADLAAVEADSPVGVLCLTLCRDCQDADRAPMLTPVRAVYRVLDHAEHTGRPIDEDLDDDRGSVR